MSTVRGHQHSFLTHERMFLWKCRRFRKKMSRPEGDSNPPTFEFMPNAPTTWAIRDRHLLSHVFEYSLWWDRYFSSKVNFWNVNGVWATVFIFDSQTGVLVKVSPIVNVARTTGCTVKVVVIDKFSCIMGWRCQATNYLYIYIYIHHLTN